MKKVKFNKWIPYEYIQLEGGGAKQAVKGTGCWQTDFPNEGFFHQWGNTYEEFESGPGNYTVGLVELEDGTLLPISRRNIGKVNDVFNKL